MASDIKWETPTVAYVNYLTTELNALADITTVLGAAIDNETNLCTYIDLELTLASLDLSAQSSPAVRIYLLESIDGGNDYETGQATATPSLIPPADKILTTIGLRPGAGAEAKLAVKTMIPIPPGRFKLMPMNNTGVAWGATGNILAYRTYNAAIV